jgi:predicted HTH domain antitoxin
MNEIIVECEKLATFHVKEEDQELLKRIIKMCHDFGLEEKHFRTVVK